MAMSDPRTTPARPAPSGLTSNLVNPHSTGYQQTTCNILCLIFVTMFVGMRIYTRIRLVKCVSWDDYLIILATLVFYADAGLFQYIVKVGLGRHLWDVSAADFSPTFLEVWTFAAMIYSVSMLLIKMSILMLYRRLFPINNFKYLWWVCAFCTVGYGLGALFSSLFACVPVRANWDLNIEPTRCINKKAFYIGNGVMNIFTDLLILCLPIPIVWRLTLELRQKIILSVVFTLGSISCVISLVRLLSIITWIHVGDADITYTLQSIVAWSEIELAACIICANAPCLRPFFTTHLPFLSLSANSASTAPSSTHPHPTTIGGKRSRAISPYPNDMDAIFDGTQDVELENYDVEMCASSSSSPEEVHKRGITTKHSYAKHGYKPSTGNMTIVSVSRTGGQGGGISRVGSRRTSSDEDSCSGKSVVLIGRQGSLRSIGEERRGRGMGREGRGEEEEEGRIVVHTTYQVQTVREDV
ncbi:hypothetical protein AUEXF2481DRAFT_88450 [Aureobasidium subglaciale EXF-2481]|uniref:Rhodopsin domain-containing protein n=1 Tax=Aureobasidium subglaciale (strain EXF-2481) TaxID=1043005 RepID=A0A074YNJ6_AURSE|nr:uncharacterized protein AUEXF2481DRAFT_88450 [Aureobasidium subglaciale EXF-2481]KEQ95627.1 hypothetical protein AUEXF2481DRAFT_88450 [Aureobasidium subglaciale EXF-2481]